MLNRLVEDPRHRAGTSSLETPRAAHGDDPRRDSTDRVRLAAITSRTMTEGSGYFPTVETRVRRRVDGVEVVTD